MTPTQKTAFDKVIALKNVTEKTSTITTKAQGTVLQSLNTADLIVVAEELKKAGW